MEGLGIFQYYAIMGYDVCFTCLYGKNAVRMIKRYSFKAERALICEQIFDFETSDENRLIDLLEYMHGQIEQQEKTGKYGVSLESYLNFMPE